MSYLESLLSRSKAGEIKPSAFVLNNIKPGWKTRARRALDAAATRLEIKAEERIRTLMESADDCIVFLGPY